MLTLQTLRKLDPSISDLSDIELEKVRDQLYANVELIFEFFRSTSEELQNPIIKIIIPTRGVTLGAFWE